MISVSTTLERMKERLSRGTREKNAQPYIETCLDPCTRLASCTISFELPSNPARLASAVTSVCIPNYPSLRSLRSPRIGLDERLPLPTIALRLLLLVFLQERHLVVVVEEDYDFDVLSDLVEVRHHRDRQGETISYLNHRHR
jgi:hypothetical protein